MGISQLVADYPNLRAALEWSLLTNSEAGLRLAGALWCFWWRKTMLAEGRRWLGAVLAAGADSRGSKGKALLGLAYLKRFSQSERGSTVCRASRPS